ncbi:hypothetical protein J4481_02475, partial [Candidatus Pacearchaeota archaeon]|nr:hypothetical protein [uncultured archaeon]MBS3076581.1 hypothetical protein [Candidatus Pacearchaeota archaeon]
MSAVGFVEKLVDPFNLTQGDIIYERSLGKLMFWDSILFKNYDEFTEIYYQRVGKEILKMGVLESNITISEDDLFYFRRVEFKRKFSKNLECENLSSCPQTRFQLEYETALEFFRLDGILRAGRM